MSDNKTRKIEPIDTSKFTTEEMKNLDNIVNNPKPTSDYVKNLVLEYNKNYKGS